MKRRSYHLTLLAAAAVAQAGLGCAQSSDHGNASSAAKQSQGRANHALTQRLRRR